MENKIDLDILKRPLIVFCICFMVATILISASHYFNSRLNKEYKDNKRIFQSVSQRYLDVDQEEKLLRDYYPKFVSLYNKGIIGREKRLNWIEALKQVREKVALPSLKYSIDPQAEYLPEYPINYSGYTLYHSSMKLDLGLLHEGDFFKLINALNETADGFFTFSECSFNMDGDQVRFEKNRSNIFASCSLYWITIELAGDQEIKIG